MKLGTEHGFQRWVSHGTILRGWLLAEQGEEREGIALIRQGRSGYAGRELQQQTYFSALLAKAYQKAGQTEEGLSEVKGGLASAQKTGVTYYEAELHRIKGELLIQSGVQGLESGVRKEAEECFSRAIGIAKNQSAKSLELRAVMSLSRLWQLQGKTEEAHQMLAEIYGWFTEGFDTADLKEAKALLEELS